MDPGGDLAAQLRPVRWPIPTEAEALADGILAFALGLIVVLVVYGLIRMVLDRRRDPRALLRAEIAASRRLAPGERLLVQARLAERLPEDGAVRVEIARALYRPVAGFDLDATEAALIRALGA